MNVMIMCNSTTIVIPIRIKAIYNIYCGFLIQSDENRPESVTSK